jgi:peptidylprolyl isomerase/peptidyl-prolyl cis-trans isomerase A (cyclophilin A)/peptidyl-prolyl cis-trans isomerase B (cyclophilin B)
VANFLQYVDDGHYNSTIFHRVIADFVVQGGGYNAELDELPTRAPIVNEANNGLANDRGTIAMARTEDPDSATSQFFFNVKDNDDLNYSPSNAGYAVFGRIVEGLDVVDEIAAVDTESRDGFDDVPIEDVILVRVERIQSTDGSDR